MYDQKKILLVEDEPLLGNLLKQRLEKEGFSVAHAKDGQEALRLLHESTPDLVLLDIILPKISGFELMEMIKADPQLENAPIIVISNLGQETDVSRGESLGAVAYFIKAKVSIDDIVGKVVEYLTNPQ